MNETFTPEEIINLLKTEEDYFSLVQSHGQIDTIREVRRRWEIRFYLVCPACSETKLTTLSLTVTGSEIKECSACKGIFGRVSCKADISRFVDMRKLSAKSTSKHRYFDFSLGKERFHGWFDPETKEVLQWG